MTALTMKDLRRQLMLTGGPCVLCGRHTHSVGVFIPDDSVAWGAAPGKQRAILYLYCGCAGDDAAAFLAVERALKRDMAARRN